MPTIEIRDITLLERLKRLKPVPNDYYDDVLYVLLKKAEAADKKPKLSGLDDLPRLVVEEVRKALDGKLAEAIRAALAPAISSISLEVPVELNVKVRLRLEPVFDVSPVSPTPPETAPQNETGEDRNAPSGVRRNDKIARTLELDRMEQRVREYLRQRGGCFQGSPRALLRSLGMAVDESLVRRLYKRLRVKGGRTCLPEAVAKEDDVVVAE